MVHHVSESSPQMPINYTNIPDIGSDISPASPDNIPEFGKLPEEVKEAIRALLAKVDIRYKEHPANEIKNQKDKIIVALKKNLDDDEEITRLQVLAEIDTWNRVIAVEAKTEVAEVKNEIAEVRNGAAKKEDEGVNLVKQLAEEKNEKIQKVETVVAQKTEKAAEKIEERSENLDELSRVLKATKDRIFQLTGEKPEDIVGEKRYNAKIKEITDGRLAVWNEQNKDWLAKLPLDKRELEVKAAKESIAVRAESEALNEFRSEIIKKYPDSKEGLNEAFDRLAVAAGVPIGKSLVGASGADVRINGPQYQMVRNIASERRDLYQDGNRIRAVPDEKWTFPAYIPGKGLFMSNDSLNIKIDLSPNDQVRVNELRSSESRDRMELDSLKNQDAREASSRQSIARDAWSKTMLQGAKASEGVRAALKARGVDLDRPESLKNVLTKENVASIKSDSSILKAIEKDELDGKNQFSHADFFNGLDSLARFIEQNKPENLNRNKNKIEQLERKLDPNNPDSYQNGTKEIYQSAYEASRENLVFLTEDLGLDGVGQEFLDGLLATLNSRLEGRARIELSEKLNSDKKRQIAEAVNALTNQNPPIFKIENGNVVSTRTSPAEKKKALLEGLSTQGVIVPPDNKLNSENLRQILGGKI